MTVKTREITLRVPDDVLLAMGTDASALAEETRILLAFHLFASGRLSAGKAARLAGLPRVHFLFEASRRGIDWLSYSDEDLRRELG